MNLSTRDYSGWVKRLGKPPEQVICSTLWSRSSAVWSLAGVHMGIGYFIVYVLSKRPIYIPYAHISLSPLLKLLSTSNQTIKHCPWVSIQQYLVSSLQRKWTTRCSAQISATECVSLLYCPLGPAQSGAIVLLSSTCYITPSKWGLFFSSSYGPREFSFISYI
jgi:hypothetical protein